MLALTVIPLGVVGLALGASGFGWSVLAATSVATGLFVVSFFAQEFAHAVVHTRLALACGGATDLLGVGTAREAAIVRFGLDPRRDALVSVAGPAAGLALSLPLLAPSDNFLATGAFPVFFLVHALSLSDGRQEASGHAARRHSRRDRRPQRRRLRVLPRVPHHPAELVLATRGHEGLVDPSRGPGARLRDARSPPHDVRTRESAGSDRGSPGGSSPQRHRRP